MKKSPGDGPFLKKYAVLNQTQCLSDYYTDAIRARKKKSITEIVGE